MTVYGFRMLLSGVILAAGAGAAPATELVYTPINPSFGGNPLNSAHLLATANAQREATASDFVSVDRTGGTTGTGGTGGVGSSDADLFVRQLQGRLLSALAGQVTEAIFGDNPQDSGTVRFGDTTVTFERTLDSIRLTIVNAADGTVTEIVVPQLVANGAATASPAASTLGAASALTSMSGGSMIGASSLTPLTIN